MNDDTIVSIAGTKVALSTKLANKKSGFSWKPPFILIQVNSLRASDLQQRVPYLHHCPRTS